MSTNFSTGRHYQLPRLKAQALAAVIAVAMMMVAGVRSNADPNHGN